MTAAVCLKCGAMKFGAFNPCPSCRFVPKETDDLARHLLASDHYFKKANLEAMGAHIKAGKPIHFHPDQLKEVTATLENIDLGAEERRVKRFFMGCLWAVGLVALGLVVGYVLYHNSR
jgi:hypothetical protein